MHLVTQSFPRACTLAVAVALCLGSIAHAAPPQQKPAGDPNRVWIRFKPGQKAQVKAQIQQTLSTVRAASASSAKAAGKLAPSISVGKTHYEFDKTNAMVMTLAPEVLEKLRADKNLIIEQDVPRYPLGESVPYGIPKVQAPDAVAVGADGTGVKVCVIDSGIKADHEDFAGIPITGYASSGQTWNTDTCGHGTHVAGTIAAVGGNGKGVVGVSPGKVSLHVIKVFDGVSCGYSYSSTLVDAANRCAQAGSKVINMSLGGSSSSSSEEAAFTTLYNQGVTVVAAAGNDGNSSKSYPASYANVISVAALDANNVKAPFSQFNDAVDIAAPGVNVLSAYPSAGTPLLVNGVSYESNPFEGSAAIVASAPLVDGGRCASSGSWSGKIVLCERGDITFADKAGNARRGGALGVAIYNNVPGPLSAATLDGSSSIPAVGLSQADGVTLRGLFGQTVTVSGVIVLNISAYSELSGTSMASPHVAGVAALLYSAKPSATAVQVRNALTASALDLGTPGRDNQFGFGLVRALDAVDSLLGGQTPGNQQPVANFSSVVTDLTAKFSDSSADPDGSIASRRWDFGDGTTSTETHPTKVYDASGTYTVTLTVTDNRSASHSKTSTLTVDAGNAVQTYSNSTDFDIPDRDATGVTSSIVVAGRSGNVPSNAQVNVNIVHTYKGDLIVDLLAPDGSVYNIHNRTGGSADNIIGTFPLNLSSEAVNGTWKLRVVDAAGSDTGKIDSWSIKI